MLAIFFYKLMQPLKRLWELSSFTIDDVKKVYREEKSVWDLFYPYIAERQSSLMGMLCGGWLIAAHGMTFSNPAYSLIRQFISQNEMGWGLFLTGSFHAYSLYAYNNVFYRNSDIPMFGRRLSLFIETIWWVFMAALFLGGFPAGLGFVLFASFGFGSYRAFQDTGNKSHQIKSSAWVLPKEIAKEDKVDV